MTLPVVLVTDAKQRKAVPIIRSLGRQGISVVAGDDSRISMGFFSRYCQKSITYPSPDRYPERFIDWLISQARHGLFQVLFAIDERTLDVVTRYQQELSAYMVLTTVDHKTYSQARDKAKTMALAESLGIPCPRTALISDDKTLEEIAAQWDFPVIIKPRSSSGSRGLRRVDSPKDLRSCYQKVSADYPSPLVQEFIHPGGETFGVEVLLNRESQPRATFVHRRLREYPISGGPSTLRESVAAPELTELGVQLLQAMGWHGVAMVEFKMDPRDGRAKLMEVNPKFWGSIALPIAAGIDFPFLLYRLSIEGDIARSNSYRTGVLCRWLLPGDILHFVFNPNRFQLTPSFFQFTGKDLHYDLLDWGDLGPIWGMACWGLVALLKPDFWKKSLSPHR